jgi:hypothetical protein
MAVEALEGRRNLIESVKASLRKAEGIVAGYQKNNSTLLITTIVSSTGATMVAGVTAAVGQAASIGTEGWRIACIIAAVFGLVSTVTTGLSQLLNISDRLSEGRQGLAKLRHLDIVITTGSIGWEEIAREYEGIAQEYPNLIQ